MKKLSSLAIGLFLTASYTLLNPSYSSAQQDIGGSESEKKEIAEYIFNYGRVDVWKSGNGSTHKNNLPAKLHYVYENSFVAHYNGVSDTVAFFVYAYDNNNNGKYDSTERIECWFSDANPFNMNKTNEANRIDDATEYRKISESISTQIKDFILGEMKQGKLPPNNLWK